MKYIHTTKLLLGLSLAAVLAIATISITDTPWAVADDGKKKFNKKPDFKANLDSDQTVPPEPNDATGQAKFWFSKDKTELKYKIKVDGLDLDGFVTPGVAGDDVTKVHLHNAPPGVAGAHVLNVYKLPSQDDKDLVIKPFDGILKGIWDDGDENPIAAPTKKLSEVLDELCAGNLYVNVHTVDHAPGALRGQMLPTDQGERNCKKLGFD